MAAAAVAADLQPSRAILLAAHFTSKTDITSLRNLIALHPATFTQRTVLDILLNFLPETTPPSTYAPLVKDIIANRVLEPPSPDTPALDTSFIEPISEASALKTLESLGFPSQKNAEAGGKKEGGGGSPQQGESILFSWLRDRVYAIDRETGAIGLLESLVAQFIEVDPAVYAWYTGSVGVLKRLIYTCQTDAEDRLIGGIGLEEFENLGAREGVRLLLGSSVSEERIGAGFEMAVPYVEYKRKQKGGEVDIWGFVFDWITGHTKGRFGIVWRVVRDWEGPEDEAVKERYLRAIMGCCYMCLGTDEETVQQLQDVVYRVAEAVRVGDLAEVKVAEVDELVERFMSGRGSIWNIFSSTAHVASEAMEEETAGELVKPSAAALRLLDLLIASTRRFAMFPLQLTVREVMRMRFTGSREDQLGLLRRALSVEDRQRNEPAYQNLRSACEFLRAESKVLGKLSQEDIEVEFLKDMLSASKFMQVTATYVTPKGITRSKRAAKPLLPPEMVEKVITHTVTDFYDKSTNGNRTRGGMKNASNTLAILYPNHSDSLPLRRLSKLLSATHALSEYSLTLTPGTPLKPVQIRLYPDPPELISRVLQSNHKAYLQLDSLVKIAADLVYGVSKPHDGTDGEPAPAEAAALKSKITGMCVEAALAEDDFETAFSFVVNKLVPTHQKNKAVNKTVMTTPDTAWQAALQAGRYRSPAMLAESMEGVATSKGIDQVQKRMELLSQALVICPAEAMMDVLRTWKQCEDELEMLLEQEIQEEKAHAGKLGDWARSLAIPSMKGAVGAGAAGQEGLLSKGPMSLLSVASTAGSLAKSLGSSAFPLGRGTKTSGTESAEGSQRGSREYDRDGWTVGEDGERVRKRDVLSGMVTSGLASGLGWMLGAKPEDMNAGQR
ncbi:hypothetical protein H072_4737 [Dactylellina haptotyla CBS 200.50]|uniref:Sec39 domain-containing protein n=1 Tax=Dactylellina haptotyla (strain CBS 200.50) TaxID=1284197 RepID=S8AJS6_DACHA|nr:hypothetical protein H072_4737 [Dactylellina haptotyla CBS 200.50]